MREFKEYELTESVVQNLIADGKVEEPVRFLAGWMTLIFGEEFRSTSDGRWIGPTYPNEEFEQACSLHSISFDLHTPNLDYDDDPEFADPENIRGDLED